MSIVNPHRFAVGGINDPTDIPGCIIWFDFSDASQMTFSGFNILTIAAKVGDMNYNTPVVGKEMKHSGNFIERVNLQFSYSLTNNTEIPLSDDITAFAMYMHPESVEGTGSCQLFRVLPVVGSGNAIIFSSAYLTPARVRWRAAAEKTAIVSRANMINPVVNWTISENLAGYEIYDDDTLIGFDSGARWSPFGCAVGSVSSMVSNRNEYDPKYYQLVVYNRILTNNEITQVRDWLATKI